MKTLASGLQNTLDGGVTFMCYAYRLIRLDGEVMGFTSHDQDLIFDDVTFIADSGYTPSQFQASEGLNVDGIEAFGFLKSDGITDTDLLAGVYDDAEITIWKVNWQNVAERVIVFKGNVGVVSVGRIAYVAEVRSISHRLNQPTGRLYQPTCDTCLYGDKCKVDPYDISPLGFAYSYDVAVQVVSDRRIFSVTPADVSSVPQNWFQGGIVTWTTGSNAKLQMEIKRDYTSGSYKVIELWEPMPFDISVSDICRLSAGCDKTVETCRDKFDNVTNFQGFPRMPGNDQILVFAQKEDKNDGSSLYL